ncbi:MAG: M15 family metallopeptidase [Flavobacterium sp.]|nr:M15 family metallopeptidase [Flavobacterium sp.]
MKIKHFLLLICYLFLTVDCGTRKPLKENKTAVVTPAAKLSKNESSNSKVELIEIHKTIQNFAIDDTTFVNLKDFSSDFVYNMKYASEDNFLKSKVYDCEACYLRYKTVKSLLNANQKFLKKGYRIMLYDCYRPLSIQKKMFEIVANPKYVADPKKGSIHNRGGAVDISLVDATGKELDMGTAFDFFGEEASHDYENLSEEVKANRKLLRKIMTQNNFRIFESEWWHYNLKNAHKDPISNFKWNCN